jgi:hypothetical protein
MHADAESVRATRAFVGSLGAGVSLAIAASLALLVVSSVVAFRGWPGAPSVPKLPDVAQLGAAAPDNGSSAGSGGAVKLPAAPARLATTTPRGARTHQRSVAATRGGSGSSVAVPASGGDGAGAASTTSGKPTAKTSPGHIFQSVGTQAADTVRQTTQAGGQAVAPIAPPVGRTLEELGAAGGSVVQGATDSAGKLLP